MGGRKTRDDGRGRDMDMGMGPGSMGHYLAWVPRYCHARGGMGLDLAGPWTRKGIRVGWALFCRWESAHTAGKSRQREREVVRARKSANEDVVE